VSEDGGERERVVRLGLRRVQLLELVQADETLRASALVRLLTLPQLERLLAGALARRYADQAPVFQEGEEPRALYLVLQGEARVRTLRAAQSVEVAPVGKGDFFGEAELVFPTQARRHSALAHGALSVAEVPAAAVAEALRAAPALEALVRQTAEARLRAANELSEFLERW
jgi:CRP-like cAMP-binding protein